MRQFRCRPKKQWHILLALITIVWIGLMSLQNETNLGGRAATTQLVLRKPSYLTVQAVFERVMVAGELYLSNIKAPGIWPNRCEIEQNDRIVKQITYVPPGYNANNIKPKLIVYFNSKAVASAKERLKKEQCPVQNCVFSSNSAQILEADAVLIKSPWSVESYTNLRHPRQIWIMYALESPYHSADFAALSKHINWTASYRRDSVLVTPYEKFVPFSNISTLPERSSINYALNKTKSVAWFVSNCNAKNGRDAYVAELKKYIDVDIYGICGDKTCKRTSQSCFQMLKRDYKFYLSFENSNCKDYITEKLYWNAYLNDLVPIVMGAHPDDYAAVAPPLSYIHVDDFESPKALAEYLHRLDEDDALYNSYFRWKGTGEFINTKFWCRLCSMLHAAPRSTPFWYNNVQGWWKNKDVCTSPGDNPESNYRWASWRHAKNDFNSLLP